LTVLAGLPVTRLSVLREVLMRRPLNYRPSGAMIVACISLFVALGGVGYAAATIGSAQIKNNSIRSKDIRNNQVATRDVRNNTLTGADIRELSLETVPEAHSANRAESAPIERVKINTSRGTAPPGPGGFGTATARCDAGLAVVGGGVQVDDPNNGFVIDDWPNGADGFTARAATAGGGDMGFTVYAICASVASIG
jgi:hypothetical protein